MAMLTWAERLLERFFALLGSTRPLTRHDRPLWAAARTLADLGELTALWLEGRIESQPGYYGRVDVDEDDAPGLTATLVALNRAGYLTNSSQAGFDGTGYDGAHWQQYAAVTGFASPDTLRWLQRAVAGTRFEIKSWGCKKGGAFTRTEALYVTFREGQPVTSFGQVTDGVIAGEIYDGAGGAAIDAACTALQVTIYDPKPGPHELWPVLREAAEAELDGAWSWPGDTVAERRAARAAWAERDPNDDGEGLYGSWGEFQHHRRDLQAEQGPAGDEPRVLTTAELQGAAEDGEQCPSCGDDPAGGQLTFDDRGPFQLIAIRTYRCRAGHRWRHETDGG
jgi:hypothetical protein